MQLKGPHSWEVRYLDSGRAEVEMDLRDVRTFSDRHGLTGHVTLHTTAEVADALRAGKITLDVIVDGLPD